MSIYGVLVRPHVFLPLGLGLGVVVALAMSASLKWTAIGMVGLLGVLPLLVMRSTRLYFIAIYLFALTAIPRGKSLDQYFIDLSHFLDLYGVPPAGDLTFVLYVSDLVLLVLVASWAVEVLVERKRIYVGPVGYLFLCFIGWATVASILKSTQFYFSFLEILRQLKFFCVYLFVANCVDSKNVLKWVIFFLIGCLVIQAGVTLVAWSVGFQGHPMSWLMSPLAKTGSTLKDFHNLSVVVEGEASSGARALGTFGNPVTTAIHLGYLIPLAFALTWTRLPIPMRMLTGAVTAFGGAALFVTFSRAALLGLFCGLVLAGTLLYIRRLIHLKVVLLAFCTGVLLLGLTVPLLVEHMTTRPSAFWGRIPLMEKALIMIVENPIFGVGLNNHTIVKKSMFGDNPKFRQEVKYPVHNHYLAVGSETGVVGLMIWLGMVYFILREAWRRVWDEDPLICGVAVGILAAYTALLVHLNGDHFAGEMARSFFSFYAGLVVALHRLQEDREDQPLRTHIEPLARGTPVRTGLARQR